MWNSTLFVNKSLGLVYSPEEKKIKKLKNYSSPHYLKTYLGKIP